MNTSRLAVTAAFARGMPNFFSDPPEPPSGGDDADPRADALGDRLVARAAEVSHA